MEPEANIDAEAMLEYQIRKIIEYIGNIGNRPDIRETQEKQIHELKVIANAEYLRGLEAAAALERGGLYYSCLEMTAWMGLPEHKRKDWATRLANEGSDNIKTLIRRSK